MNDKIILYTILVIFGLVMWKIDSAAYLLGVLLGIVIGEVTYEVFGRRY